MSGLRAALLWSIPVLSVAMTSAALASDAQIPSTYAYATDGITDHIAGRSSSEWKLLLDASNLGGKELEMAELTLQPGTSVASHEHGSVEIIYVLSGMYEHEVNGKLYRLTPGMVGLVRPGDHVRHLVPKTGAAKLLIIWTPGGEVKRVLGLAKGTPVAPLQSVEASASSP